MAGTEDDTAEPSDAEITDIGVGNTALKPHTRRSFQRVRREMTDEELSNPAVQKMMMDELERLERERDDLSGYRDKHAAADKRCAVLDEKLKPKIAADVFFGSCTTIGSIMIGLAPSVWKVGVIGIALASLGVALVGAGIAAKVILK